MAFNNTEVQQYKNELDTLIEAIRPPVEIRNEVDLIYEIDAKLSSVIIYEVRPSFMNPEITTSLEIAKAKFTKSREIWTVYWMRASGNWEKYPHEPNVSNLSQFFRVVSEDALCCFFG